MAILTPKYLMDTILVNNDIQMRELEHKINDSLKRAEMVNSSTFTILIQTNLSISLAEKLLKEAGYWVKYTTKHSHPLDPTCIYKLTLVIPPQGK